MKKLLFISSILICRITFAQQDTIFVLTPDREAMESEKVVYKTDTILQGYGFEHPYLVGTCVFPTYGMANTWAHGLNLVKITKSDCNSHGEEAYSESAKIMNYQLTEDSLIVELKIIDNCCFEFLCFSDVDDNGILHIKYIGYGSLCACMCCFGTTYHFGVEHEEYYEEIKGIMLEDDEKTLIRFKDQ